MMPSLNDRFFRLWRRIGASGDPRPRFADLVSRYAEPWRVYHRLTHIETMLAELDTFPGLEEARSMSFSAIEMAIWYHDVVYSTQAKDNEERSADVFRVVARSSCFTGDYAEKVAKLILATTHLIAPNDATAGLLCDVDLAILGQPEAAFDEYERQIREEYGWVPEEQFRKGRAGILENFLGRRRIYSTDFFRDKYGNQARKNLIRSIERLRTM
jgi:predicted metal-dependent HD superfamily phosphohydrolase